MFMHRHVLIVSLHYLVKRPTSTQPANGPAFSRHPTHAMNARQAGMQFAVRIRRADVYDRNVAGDDGTVDSLCDFSSSART